MRLPALSLQQQPSTMLHTGARAANRVRNLRGFSFLQPVSPCLNWQWRPLLFRRSRCARSRRSRQRPLQPRGTGIALHTAIAAVRRAASNHRAEPGGREQVRG